MVREKANVGCRFVRDITDGFTGLYALGPGLAVAARSGRPSLAWDVGKRALADFRNTARDTAEHSMAQRSIASTTA